MKSKMNFFLMAFGSAVALIGDAVLSQQVPVASTESSANGSEWPVEFTPNVTNIKMETQFQVALRINLSSSIQGEGANGDFLYQVKCRNEDIARVEEKLIREDDFDQNSKTWEGNITIEALFLGKTDIFVERINLSKNNQTNELKNSLKVIITREERAIDHIFTGSIILLCSLLYINFGAALDLSVLRTIVMEPIGPLIGLGSQVLIMPLLSYGLGYLIFPNSPELHLGLFFTGVSPSGGASNIWTVILNGNINLSVLMTTINNLIAFLSMPLLVFTLGSTIFARAKIEIPYFRIASFSIGLIIPLLIGLAIQKCSPRLTRILVRLLKPISSCLLIFIIIFAIIVNLYIFKLFSWQILLAGFALPFLGYLIGWLASKALQQSSMDSLTIAIETGIQNTGIAIFMLKGLDAPDADITTVIPVAVAIMTPLPLLGIYLYQRCCKSNIQQGLPDHTTSLKNEP